MTVLKVKSGDEWIPVLGDGRADARERGNLFAWVNLNGIDMTERDKFNVAGVTRLGDGYYRIVFDDDPPDANYASAFGVGTVVGVGPTSVSPFAARTSIASSEKYEFIVCYANGITSARADQDYISIIFFGKEVL